MNQRDLELLSAYLDGQLNASDLARLEARLKTDPELVSVLNDLRATRSLLRKLPKRRAPRNFTLTRKMVGLNPPLPRAYPIFKYASVFAALLLLFSFGVNSTSRFITAFPYGVGGGMGGGGGADQSIESYAEAPMAAATEAPATEAPAEAPLANAPMPTQAPPEATARSLVAETPSAKSGGAENATGVNQPPAESVAQRSSVPISSAWQIGLAAVAILSAALMFFMRQMAINRWRK